MTQDCMNLGFHFSVVKYSVSLTVEIFGGFGSVLI